MTARSKPSVEVHIDELVLHGFAPGDRRGIGDAVERELARLLAARGLPVPGADVGVARVSAGPAAPTGGAIAEAVYGAIGGTAKGRGGPR